MGRVEKLGVREDFPEMICAAAYHAGQNIVSARNFLKGTFQHVIDTSD
jgi:hypothetical protein